MWQIRRFAEILRTRGFLGALRVTNSYLQSEMLRQIDSVYRRLFELRYSEGIYVMERDWDNLVLLDACRYDYFEEYTSFDGDLSRVVSRGFSSWPFMQENFVGEQFHDTVYITGNPKAERLDQDTFHTVETVLNRWDSDTGTVLPADVTEVAIEAQEQYPNKRIIVHYMQPHMPYLGDTARKFDEKFKSSGWVPGKEDKKLPGSSPWELFRQGNLSKEELSELYVETFEIVESHVQRLVDELVGKTVISADHGENLGERPYGVTLTSHNQHSKETRFVPWMELPFEDRKSVTEDRPIGFEYSDDEYVQERLEDLGYV